MSYKARFLFLILFLVLFWYLGKIFSLNSQRIEEFLKRFPLILSGIIFTFLYVSVTLFVWPAKDIFKIVGAFLFGAYLSTLFIFLAEICNAFILFSLARYLGRSFVEEKFKTNVSFSQLDKKLAQANFLWLFLLRFVPLVPFRFLDLACGLTAISFRKYILAVIFGSPVRIFWIQYVLSKVGRSIFINPTALTEYIAQDKIFFLFSLGYLFFVLLLALKLKKK